MTSSDDYRDEMLNRRLSDDDVEAILSKRAFDDPTLTDLASRLVAFDPERFEADASQATPFAAKAAALARSGKTTKVAATAVPRGGLSLTPRLATAAVAALLLLGMTGVAVASNGAVPGDALYGIDRAVEIIGLGDGGAAERLSEANDLAADGRTSEALTLLAESVGSESGQAAEALMNAAERLREMENGSDKSRSVRQSLADLLEWMADPDAEGKEFGQGVADRARELGGSGDNASGRPEDAGNRSGQGNPGDGNSGADNPGVGKGNSGSPPGRDK